VGKKAIFYLFLASFRDFDSNKFEIRWFYCIFIFIIYYLYSLVKFYSSFTHTNKFFSYPESSINKFYNRMKLDTT